MTNKTAQKYLKYKEDDQRLWREHSTYKNYIIACDLAHVKSVSISTFDKLRKAKDQERRPTLFD